MIFIYIFCFLLACFISIIWVYLIDDMKEKHPDYKGDDFFNDDEDQSK